MQNNYNLFLMRSKKIFKTLFVSQAYGYRQIFKSDIKP